MVMTFVTPKPSILDTRNQFYQHGITLIQAHISIHMYNQMWDVFLYPFQKINGVAIKV